MKLLKKIIPPPDLFIDVSRFEHVLKHNAQFVYY